MYEQVTHLETNSVDRGLDTTINESINEGTSSIYEPYVAGARVRDKFSFTKTQF